MIRKIALIELIKYRLKGKTTNDNNIDNRMVSYYIGRAFNQLLYETFRKDFDNLDSYTKTYLNVDVLDEESTEISYSVLPAPIVQFPLVADGIRNIQTMKGGSFEFAPMTNDELSLSDGLDVNIIDDVIGYAFKNGRIEYKGMTSDILDGGGVRMDLVIPFEEYEDMDYVQIPSGQDERLFQLVVNSLFGIPYDSLNDNNERMQVTQEREQ